MPTAGGEIGHVSDTARWVAVYRAMETERADAIFRDPFARALAGERGEAIVRTMRRGRSAAWAMIVRTAVFDEIILDLVARHGIDLVVNLAAGLDARPWRMPLPAALRWVDVDLPDILAYKAGVIGDAPPVCRYEAIAADLADAGARRALLERLGAGSRATLVLSEGLLIYLGADDVAALARDLATMPAARWWVTDLASPQLLRWMIRSWGRAVEAGHAPFRFAPAEGTAFFRPFGWREARFHSSLEDARRLRRQMPGAWLWRLLGRLMPKAKRAELVRFSGIVVLERA